MSGAAGGSIDSTLDGFVNTVGQFFGDVGRETMSGIKEITGAKAAEEANKLARQQFEETKANAETDRLEAQQKTARDQVTQSNMANRLRSKTAGGFNINPGAASTLGGDERDFLGL